MVYQGFFEILMITLISRKKLGGYKIMRYTVIQVYIQENGYQFFCTLFSNFKKMSMHCLHQIICNGNISLEFQVREYTYDFQTFYQISYQASKCFTKMCRILFLFYLVKMDPNFCTVAISLKPTLILVKILLDCLLLNLKLHNQCSVGLNHCLLKSAYCTQAVEK